MTKLKKLLLTLAPISAVIIATPIILTSCSTNAEQNNGGGSAGGGNGSGEDTGNGGGSGSENDSQNPNLTADTTNSNSFKPTTNKGLFNVVETTVKAGRPGDESKQIESAITSFSNPSDADVKDAINVWSFNKWFGANTKVQYVSNIENPVVKKDEKTKKWNINFVYKFKITTNGDKKEDVYAERSFDAKDVDLSATKGVVDFTTNASKFMVNGKDMLKDTPKLYNVKAEENAKPDLVKEVKDFLDATTSKFDIRNLVTDYVANKNIKGEQTVKSPTWDETKVKEDKALTYNSSNPSEIEMNLTSKGDPNWGNCIDTTTYAAIERTFKEERYQTRFKKLVNTNDYDIIAVDYGKEIKNDNKTSSMIITIRFKKKETIQGIDTNPTLTLKINGFAKVA